MGKSKYYTGENTKFDTFSFRTIDRVEARKQKK